MGELIVCIVGIIAILYHATCVLLNRNELKRLNELIASKPPATLEKKREHRVVRRTTRFTDRSKKWLASKGKTDKEVD